MNHLLNQPLSAKTEGMHILPFCGEHLQLSWFKYETISSLNTNKKSISTGNIFIPLKLRTEIRSTRTSLISVVNLRTESLFAFVFLVRSSDGGHTWNISCPKETYFPAATGYLSRSHHPPDKEILPLAAEVVTYMCHIQVSETAAFFIHQSSSSSCKNDVLLYIHPDNWHCLLKNFSWENQ